MNEKVPCTTYMYEVERWREKKGLGKLKLKFQYGQAKGRRRGGDRDSWLTKICCVSTKQQVPMPPVN